MVRQGKDIVGIDVFLATLLVALSISVAQQQASAQQSVEEFLKPTTHMWGPIYNDGPMTGSKNNPAYPYYRVCKQVDPRTISCRTYVAAQPSGGGKQWSPWYWVMPDQGPMGYEVQSVSFSLPARDASGTPAKNAPDYCYGDDASPFQPAVPLQRGSPDTSWTGHKYGAKHAFAVCYILREDANGGQEWLYTFQGQEGGGPDVYIWPGNSDDGNRLVQIKWNNADRQVWESAELDVVYVKSK